MCLQDNIAKIISSKETTATRFKGIQQMWIGADYWPIEGTWKWRNAYVDFDGNLIPFCCGKSSNQLINL